MALSFHVVVSVLPLLGLFDVVLLSIRALVSRRYYSLAFCYALMGVQESVLLLELVALVGQVLSTYLLTAGMWMRMASLLWFFGLLWVLRVFFTAFTIVYKDVLIPARTEALVQQQLPPKFIGDWVAVPSEARAWHTGGYGAAVSLDVLCCCLYYLTVVYLLGYVSDKTLYVPYHRRRWRQLQQERAFATAAALDEGDIASVAGATRKRLRKEERRRKGRRVVAGYPPVISLTRTPSFAQWGSPRRPKEKHRQRRDEAGTDSGIRDATAFADSHCRGSATVPKDTPLGNQLESPSPCEYLPQPSNPLHHPDGDGELAPTPFSPCAAARSPPYTTQLPSTLRKPSSTTATASSETLISVPNRDPRRHENVAVPVSGRAATPVVGDRISPKSPSAVLPLKLRPLRLQHRFSRTAAREKERQLQQYATALATLGYQSPKQRDVSASRERAAGGENGGGERAPTNSGGSCGHSTSTSEMPKATMDVKREM